MLNAIVRFSLQHRTVVLVLASALLGAGIYSLSRAKYDVFPEFAPPQVVIQTEATGLAPEQVELLVTQPIENAVNGVPGIHSVRSNSAQGLSVVTAVFADNTNIYLDRQVVSERLSTLSSRLPAGITPTLAPLTSSTSTVMAIGLTSDSRSLMDVRTVADWTVRLRLLAVPGVSSVAVFGGDVKQWQVQFSPQELIQHEISVSDLVNAAGKATGIRGAGFITTPNQRITLQSQGQTVTPDALARTVILQRNGSNLTLGDVAHVVEAPAPPIGAASVMGKPAVMLMVSAQYGSNTMQLTHSLDAALQDLRPAVEREGIRVHASIFRPATFIETALANIRSSLVIGAILVVVVLFLFLFNLRTAAISCAAIPLSLFTAVIVLERMGYSLNTMTLGGLAIAIGEVVDDAVIDVENIHRRLRENRLLDDPIPVMRVVLDASLEVRSAVVYATFTVILVFLPVVTMSGLAGSIFSPLGAAYIWAILASLGVALTVTPALSLVLLANRSLPPETPPLVRWSKQRYEGLLRSIERRPGIVLTAVAALIVTGLMVVPFLGASFIPDLREGHFVLHMTTVPGTSLDQSIELGNRVTKTLLKVAGVKLVAQRAGRAELFEDTSGTQSSEFEIGLAPRLSGPQTDATLARIRGALARYPGATFSINTFLAERIDEVLSGYQAGVVVSLFGNELQALDKTARNVAALLQRVPGAADVQVQAPPGAPEVEIELRPADLARWGFDSVHVLDAVRTAFGGETVGQVYQASQVIPVTVILDQRDRESVSSIGDLPLRAPAGNYVRLRDLADIFESSGRYTIAHVNARRVQAITCNVSGRDVASFVAEAKRDISHIRLPAGTYVEFGGTAAAQARSRQDLIAHALLAGVAILLLLAVVMRNWRNLLLVLANLPFALVGGVLIALATGGNLSLGSLIGFVTVLGITLRNSIMLISHYEHLVEAEGMTWGLDAAIRGASERLAPILMTALVTGLGLLPLAIGSGEAGREIEGPMAVIILGGLATSTMLNLLVLPTLALRFGRFEKVGDATTAQSL